EHLGALGDVLPVELAGQRGGVLEVLPRQGQLVAVDAAAGVAEVDVVPDAVGVGGAGVGGRAGEVEDGPDLDVFLGRPRRRTLRGVVVLLVLPARDPDPG